MNGITISSSKNLMLFSGRAFPQLAEDIGNDRASGGGLYSLRWGDAGIEVGCNVDLQGSHSRVWLMRGALPR